MKCFCLQKRIFSYITNCAKTTSCIFVNAKIMLECDWEPLTNIFVYYGFNGCQPEVLDQSMITGNLKDIPELYQTEIKQHSSISIRSINKRLHLKIQDLQYLCDFLVFSLTLPCCLINLVFCTLFCEDSQYLFERLKEIVLNLTFLK